MPPQKQYSNPQRYEGGINENIGISEYTDGLYSVMDNIKLNAAGRLKRDFGYTLWNDISNPQPGQGDYIPFAGKTQFIIQQDRNSLNNYIVRQCQTAFTPFINREGVTGDFDLIANYNTVLKNSFDWTQSFQKVKCIETKNDLYLLAENNSFTNQLIKTNFKSQIDAGYSTTSPLIAAPVYNNIASCIPFVDTTEIPNVGYFFTDTNRLDEGDYAYKLTFISDNGTESILSAQSQHINVIQHTIYTDNNKVVLNIGNFQFTRDTAPFIASTNIKSIRIYRTHNSGAADGLKNNNADGTDPNVYWFVAEVPFTLQIFADSSGFYYQDTTPDLQLISAYYDTGNINPYGSFGIYQDNRLIISGDKRYPELVYISQPDNDTFEAKNSLIIPLANSNNFVSAIATIGNSIYVFNKKFGICRLIPNSSSMSAPYTIYPISSVYGCDEWAINAGGLIYFIFNNHLYMFNGTDIQDIGSPIQPTLSQGVTTKLMYNSIKEYIYINVKDINYNSIGLYCFSIRHKHFTTESLDFIVYGDKQTIIDDIFFNKTRGILIAAVSHTNNYDHAIFKESSDYSSPYIWGTNSMELKPRISSIVKPFVPGTRGKLNKLQVYGINQMGLITVIEGNMPSNIIDATMTTRRGEDLMLNLSGESFEINFIWNTTNEEAVLDYWEYVFTAKGGRINKGTKTGKRISK